MFAYIYLILGFIIFLCLTFVIVIIQSVLMFSWNALLPKKQWVVTMLTLVFLIILFSLGWVMYLNLQIEVRTYNGQYYDYSYEWNLPIIIPTILFGIFALGSHITNLLFITKKSK